jgi:hypothetical protein
VHCIDRAWSYVQPTLPKCCLVCRRVCHPPLEVWPPPPPGLLSSILMRILLSHHHGNLFLLQWLEQILIRSKIAQWGGADSAEDDNVVEQFFDELAHDEADVEADADEQEPPEPE